MKPYATLIKIAIIQQGKILQIDTPCSLYWSPNHLETATFIGESIVLPAHRVDKNMVQCQLGCVPIQPTHSDATSGQIFAENCKTDTEV